MATVTPNFNWPVPTSTDLVKDGATAIEALGDSIDASLVDLKGGTTGQVLSKTSNTDMDFTWVTSDDANAIQNSIVNAKGDLIGASANDTPAILSVGANGETLVADSSTSTGLRWQGDYAAGKNKIINGDFGIWQRGTSASVAGYNIYGTADRFCYSSIGGTATASRQTFTPGTAPVAGYEGQYFSRLTLAASGTTYFDTLQFVEDVRTLAGQTVTFSYWAKASTGMAVSVTFFQNMGSGGSGTLQTNGTPVTLTTSWVRYSQTVTLPSLAGSTVGTSSKLGIGIGYSSGGTLANATFDVWGVQLEAGSVATAFQTATGTIQGELDACRRYLPAITTPSGFGQALFGYAYATNGGVYPVSFDVQARVAPTGITIPAISGSTFIVYNKTNNDVGVSAVTFDVASVNGATILSTATLTQGDATRMLVKGSGGYILFTGCEL